MAARANRRYLNRRRADGLPDSVPPVPSTPLRGRQVRRRGPGLGAPSHPPVIMAAGGRQPTSTIDETSLSRLFCGSSSGAAARTAPSSPSPLRVLVVALLGTPRRFSSCQPGRSRGRRHWGLRPPQLVCLFGLPPGGSSVGRYPWASSLVRGPRPSSNSTCSCVLQGPVPAPSQTPRRPPQLCVARPLPRAAPPGGHPPSPAPAHLPRHLGRRLSHRSC